MTKNKSGARLMAVAQGAQPGAEIANIVIFTDIDAWWGMGGQDVIDQLAGQSWEKVNVWISSMGGSIEEGFKMHDALKSVQAPTEAFLLGTVASIATVVACACDRVTASMQSHYMIHQGTASPWGYFNVQELEDITTVLANDNERIRKIYARKTGLSEEALEGMMARDYWMTPEQAKDLGFIDEVVDHITLPLEDMQPSESDPWFDSFWFSATKAQARLVAQGHKRMSAERCNQLRSARSLNYNNKMIGQKIVAFFEAKGWTLKNKEGNQVKAAELTDALGTENALFPTEEVEELVVAGIETQATKIRAEFKESDDNLQQTIDELLQRVTALETAGNEEAEEGQEGEDDESLQELKDQVAELQASQQRLADRIAKKTGSKKTGAQTQDKTVQVAEETAEKEGVVAFGKKSALFAQLKGTGFSEGEYDKIMARVKQKRANKQQA